jgi:phage recombination protein Bet
MSNIVVNNSYNIDPSIWATLKNSLYTGAKDESIKMVIDYCKAGNLDPLQKPVHIVPMSIKNPQTGKYEYKDTIMAGIGLYRIQAARSNQYAGVSEPEYGEDVQATLDGVKITYPKWCKIVVKKIVHNTIVEFSAKEYWIENYATRNKDTSAPNTMWLKRPYGQLAKCAEAQALRKAFPEIVSQQPTAEEMEGKTLYEFNECSVNNEPKNITPKAQTLRARLDDLIANSEEDTVNIKEVTTPECTKLAELVLTHNIPAETVEKWCQKAGVSRLDELDKDKVTSCIDHINRQYAQEIEAV